MPAAPFWLQAVSCYPFATALLPGWRDAAAELPEAYSAALDAALAAFDPERPLTERYQQLCASRARLAELAAAGDTHIATQLLRLRVWMAIGEPQAARQHCVILLELRERAAQAAASQGQRERADQPPRTPQQEQTDALRDDPPDAVLILPWNIADEVKAQLADLAELGVRFTTAVPQVRVRQG